jgi:two-component sensor histidine kinase
MNQPAFAHNLHNLRDRLNLLQQLVNELPQTAQQSAQLTQLFDTIQSSLPLSLSDEVQIQASLQEKEALLAEIHHRVKNNLHIISSLFYLQANRIQDQQVREILQDSRNRVNSMALVHESLYRTQNFASINFAQYVQHLAMSLFRTYDIEPDAIAFRVDVINNVSIKLDHAVPCGLIVNELITNALKHGFRSHCSGEVIVSLEMNDAKQVVLTISNNGEQLPEGFDLNQVRSMGLRLVMTLVKQLNGAIEVESGTLTKFRIMFLS